MGKLKNPNFKPSGTLQPGEAWNDSVNPSSPLGKSLLFDYWRTIYHSHIDKVDGTLLAERLVCEAAAEFDLYSHLFETPDYLGEYAAEFLTVLGAETVRAILPHLRGSFPVSEVLSALQAAGGYLPPVAEIQSALGELVADPTSPLRRTGGGAYTLEVPAPPPLSFFNQEPEPEPEGRGVRSKGADAGADDWGDLLADLADSDGGEGFPLDLFLLRGRE